jgi:hypothetical protein
MTTYNGTAVADTTIAFQKGITLQQGRALRDNPIAIAEGAAGAPYVAAGWHPYDGVTVGDGADGVIYDFAVDGAVNSVTSPNFVDGYEYQFHFEGLTINGNYTLGAQWYAETSAAYSTIFNILTWSAFSGYPLYGLIYAIHPRMISKLFRYEGDGGTMASSNATSAFNDALSGGRVSRSTAQKMLNAKFTVGSGGTFQSGKIFMFKRLCFNAA